MRRAFPWIISLLLAVWCVRLHLNLKKLELAIPQETLATEATAISAETNSEETLTTADKAELGELRKERADLLRLRNEVRQLRDGKKELEAKVATQEQKLKEVAEQKRLAPDPVSPALATQLGIRNSAADQPVLKSGMIGAMFMASNNVPLVRAIAENSPAGRAGIKPGTVVLSIDGTSTTNMPFNQVMQAIRGDEGTQVVLVVDDGTPNGIRQITLTREAVNPADVKVKQ